jgi:hypothetical protein
MLKHSDAVPINAGVLPPLLLGHPSATGKEKHALVREFIHT